LDAATFRQQLVKLVPHITSVVDAENERKAAKDHKKQRKPGLVKMVGVNIAFSHKGFVKMGINDSSLTTEGTRDPFLVGQEQEAVSALGDPKKSDGTPDWEESFLQNIHGVILITGDSDETIGEKKDEIDQIFHSKSIDEIVSVSGSRLEGELSANEHFGFLDGISEPAVKGFDNPEPVYPPAVDPGIIITGYKGDQALNKREPWAFDGSFLVFRYLFQLVPEFNNYLKRHALPKDGEGKDLTPEEGSDLLGARMVGRWKSGAPIVLTPWKDDSNLSRSNDFKFEQGEKPQFKCPFGAHIRKTNPRNDIGNTDSKRIMRRGIPFGPEVNLLKESEETHESRGLLFACYQTSITNGFKLHQQFWANNVKFRPVRVAPFPGLDPLIGQGTNPRTVSGLDPLNDKVIHTLEDFVIPKGGEYFFSPSLTALEKTIGKA